MAEKMTTMILKVDLHCEECYKKVKKVICKFPQIREQRFDEKQNIVTIEVMCCSPEKIRDKLCCKGCGAIKSIEIVEPPPPGKTPTKTPPKTPPSTSPPHAVCCGPCSEGRPGGPCFESNCRPPPSPPRPRLVVCCGPCSQGRPCGHCRPPPPPPPPRPVCCVPCSQGRLGGLCFEGYCGPPPCYEGYFHARPVYDSYGGGRPCYVSHCYEECFNEDNATVCTIM